jgi:hypothetical protein
MNISSTASRRPRTLLVAVNDYDNNKFKKIGILRVCVVCILCVFVLLLLICSWELSVFKKYLYLKIRTFFFHISFPTSHLFKIALNVKCIKNSRVEREGENFHTALACLHSEW